MQPTSRLSRNVLPDSRIRGEASDAMAIAAQEPDACAADSSLLCFGPLHYEPNYHYPLFVWLHGPGEDERNLLSIMPEMSLRNYVAVAPRGLPTVVPQGGGTGKGIVGKENDLRYVWADPSSDGRCDPDSLHRRVMTAIEEAKHRYSVALNRVFIGGAGPGGTAAMRVALMSPESFAGVLSLNGPAPRGGMPLARWSDARRLAVFLGAGINTPSYPVSCVCDDLRLLHTAGFDVTLRHYPWGQNLHPTMLRDMNQWIMETMAMTRKV